MRCCCAIIIPGRGAEEDGEPAGWGVGCGSNDAVTQVSGDEHPIAGGEWERSVHKFQHGFACQQHNPFVFRLIVPESLGGCVAERNDSLQSQVFTHPGDICKCVAGFGSGKMGAFIIVVIFV